MSALGIPGLLRYNPEVRRGGARLPRISSLQSPCRGVAQPGRALGSGPRGRWFESTRPDQFRPGGFAPPGPPTRSLARRFAGALRSRGSLAYARSLLINRRPVVCRLAWTARLRSDPLELPISPCAFPRAPSRLRRRRPLSHGVRNHAVHADQRQTQGDGRKHRKQEETESSRGDGVGQRLLQCLNDRGGGSRLWRLSGVVLLTSDLSACV
jgi:hypothetical protein